MAFNQSGELAGLSTYTVTAPAAGSYSVDWKNSIQRPSQGGLQSSLVTTVVQNSSTVFTSSAGADGGHFDLICAVGDTINVTTSSSAAADTALNAVKTQVAISSGV